MLYCNYTSTKHETGGRREGSYKFDRHETSVFFVGNILKMSCMGIEERVTELDPRHLEDFTACLEVGCARFVLKKISHIIKIKRNWIRFTCVLLVHYKISLIFANFRFASI